MASSILTGIRTVSVGFKLRGISAFHMVYYEYFRIFIITCTRQRLLIMWLQSRTGHLES